MIEFHTVMVDTSHIKYASCLFINNKLDIHLFLSNQFNSIVLLWIECLFSFTVINYQNSLREMETDFEKLKLKPVEEPYFNDIPVDLRKTLW